MLLLLMMMQIGQDYFVKVFVDDSVDVVCSKWT